MDIRNFFRMLVAACTVVAAVQASATPTLLVDSNGMLTGVRNVDVGGINYNVSFAEGSCNQNFNNCDPSAFAFHTEDSARLAAQALLDQVFVDGIAGNFDTVTDSVYGCHSKFGCYIFIPAGLQGDYFTGMRIDNEPTGRDYLDRFVWEPTSHFDSYIFAVFELASPPTSDVPEPATIALIGVSLAGLAVTRRRKA